jgi:hypothetical protein
MDRQDLIAFSGNMHRRIGMVLAALVFGVIWIGVLFSYGSVILDRFGVRAFLAGAAVPVVALLAVDLKNFTSAPKCPHC